MKITEIKEDMYQYISLRDSIESNKVIDEAKRLLINTIELKYKNFFLYIYNHATQNTSCDYDTRNPDIFSEYE